MLTHFNILMLYLKKNHPNDFNINFYEYELPQIK